MLQDGIMVVPGTTVEKVLKCFEQFFGAARIQKTPCDAGIQQQDMSQELGQLDSSRYRSIIGPASVLVPRPGGHYGHSEGACNFHVKANTLLTSTMATLVGCLKSTGDMGLKLGMPEYGKRKRKEGCDFQWLLETFTDADWASNKSHANQQAAPFTF